MTLQRSYTDDISLMAWLHDYIWPSCATWRNRTASGLTPMKKRNSEIVTQLSPNFYVSVVFSLSCRAVLAMSAYLKGADPPTMFPRLFSILRPVRTNLPFRRPARSPGRRSAVRSRPGSFPRDEAKRSCNIPSVRRRACRACLRGLRHRAAPPAWRGVSRRCGPVRLP